MLNEHQQFNSRGASSYTSSAKGARREGFISATGAYVCYPLPSAVASVLATACKIQRSIASNGVLHTGYHTRGQWFFDFDLQLLLMSVSEHEAQEAFSSHMSTVFETFTSCPTYYAAAACLYICRCPRSIIFTHKRCHTRHTHTVVRKPSRTVAQRASPASSRRRLSTCCACSCLAAGEVCH